MIAAMFNFKQIKRSILVVVLEKDNLDRMANADAVTLESKFRAGGALEPPMFPMDYNLIIATEFNKEELYRRAKINSPEEFLAWLERGRAFIKGVDGMEHAQPIRREPL